MKYLNIHLLRTVPFSNLNRDDTGTPKTAVYGGVPRARISSQARKRAARIGFETSTGERTVRSKLLSDHRGQLHQEIVEGLTNQGLDVDDTVTNKVTAMIDKAVAKLVRDGKNDRGEDRDQTLVWVAEDDELNRLARKIIDTVASEDDSEIDPADVLHAQQTRSLTIAAFGRMFASRPDLQVEAAVQVAHALTTHEQTVDQDYFTAVDDLSLSLTGHAGAGHLDLAEFTSGTFYEHLNVDLDQLAANWIVSDDEADTRRRLKAFYEALLLEMPSGKTNTTAPVGLPDHIVMQPSTRPVSYAPAFEQAVRPSTEHGSGYAATSAARLDAYTDQVTQFAPSQFAQPTTVSTLTDAGGTLDELIDQLVETTVAHLAGRRGQEAA